MKKSLLNLILGLSIFVSGCQNYSPLFSNSNLDIQTVNTSSNLKYFSPESLTEKQKEIIHDYAPIIFQATHKKSQPEYWDFITSVDFDGDLRGNNNEESLKSNKFPLPATVYYALTETETHYFIVYSFFHPLDWAKTHPIVPFTWHENDMENIQIVVKKSALLQREKVILLSAQAHLGTSVYSAKNTGVTSGKKKLEKDSFRLLNENLTNGSLMNSSEHCGVYVQSGGHGIYSMTSEEKEFQSLNPPKLKEGFTFIPSKTNISDYYKEGQDTFYYQLKPIYDTFWIHYLNNKNIGDGKLMDGFFNYSDELVNYAKIPRHFDSDRTSGPGKSDAGILPFAFSYSLTEKDLGVIFFNPAKKYSQTLEIKGKWSRDYTYNPYVRDLLKINESTTLVNLN